MKRIVILFEFPTLNGGELSMLAGIDRLRDRFEFVALAPEEGRLAEQLRACDILHAPIELFDTAGVRLPREMACRFLLQAVRQLSPDLLHANSLSMGRLTGSVAAELTIPTTAHLRDIIKLSRQAVADLNRNRLLAAVSRATQSFHLGEGIEAHRLRVVYNGVDCTHFQPRQPTGSLRTELDLATEDILIATIGQIGLRKGQDVLADAAIRVAGMLPNLQFLLVGERNSSKAESIRFERAIVRQFVEAGHGSRLHCLGYRTDVDRLLGEIDLLVHPAQQEPLGRVLLEAAASGVPIIATDVGGTSEILTDDVSARLIPPGNAAVLADAIRELAGDPEKRRRFAAAARDRVKSHFSIEQAAANLAEFWGTLL